MKQTPRLSWELRTAQGLARPMWQALTGAEGEPPALSAGWQLGVTPSVGGVRGWIHIGWRGEVIADVRHEFQDIDDAKVYAEQLAEQLIRMMFGRLLGSDPSAKDG